MATDYNTIAYLETVGSSLSVHYKDGQKVAAFPDGRGRYLPAKGPVPVVEPPPPPPPPGGSWTHPAPGTTVTSPYGDRAGGFHYGVDLSSTTAPVGVSVVAVTDMTITTAVDAYEGGNETAGTYVKGNNGTYTFSYAHGADNTLAVSNGQAVTAGTHLFYEGGTGNVTGTHLHFEIYEGVYTDPWAGYPVYPPDPEPILNANGVYL